MERACVLEPDLKRQLQPLMRDMRPRRSIFDGAFIAANQVHNSAVSNPIHFRFQFRTVFRISMERWADGLKTLEMVQGGNFCNQQGTWEAHDE